MMWYSHAALSKDPEHYSIYYGAADQVIGVATADLTRILKVLSYSLK